MDNQFRTKEKKVREYVRRQIAFIAKDEKVLEQSSSKAHLSQLRRGLGKKPGELPELWGMFLKDMPEELMGEVGKTSYAEQAIYTALTLFALHQQGHIESMGVEGEENHLGRAARRLVGNDEEEENVRKKLCIMAASDDMTELSYHLKTIIKLLSSKDIKLDYVDLTRDLYWFQFEKYVDRIRLKWGQDFYRNVQTNENGEEESNEE